VQLPAAMLLARLHVSAANQRLLSSQAASHGEEFHLCPASVTETPLIAAELTPHRRSLAHCWHNHSHAVIIIFLNRNKSDNYGLSSSRMTFTYERRTEYAEVSPLIVFCYCQLRTMACKKWDIYPQMLFYNNRRNKVTGSPDNTGTRGKWLAAINWCMCWWRVTVVECRSLASELYILHSTCSWWVTTYVGKPSVTSQPTRPTQPFILSRSINWVVSCNRMFASSHEWRHLVNAYKVKAWCGWLERWCVC